MVKGTNDNEMAASDWRARRWCTFVSRLVDSRAVSGTVKPPSVALVAGLSSVELAAMLRGRLYDDKHWARDRREVWSARSSFVHFLTFSLAVLAIVFLGIAKLDGFAVVGFICTTVGTTVAGVESFFNWRSRWIAADAALAGWHDIEERLALYVASTAEASLDNAQLLAFDVERRAVWSEMSQTWLDERRGAKSSDNNDKAANF